MWGEAYMVNEYIEGIAKGLKSRGYPIYIEEIPMNFSRPCYFIRCEVAEEAPHAGGYTMQNVKMIVEFYGGTAETAKTYKGGRNYIRHSEEDFIFKTLSLIEVSGRFYSPTKLCLADKSQRLMGNTLSDAEGIGAILTLEANYRRFIRDKEPVNMKRLIQNREV